MHSVGSMLLFCSNLSNKNMGTGAIKLMLRLTAINALQNGSGSARAYVQQIYILHQWWVIENTVPVLFKIIFFRKGCTQYLRFLSFFNCSYNRIKHSCSRSLFSFLLISEKRCEVNGSYNTQGSNLGLLHKLICHKATSVLWRNAVSACERHSNSFRARVCLCMSGCALV